MEKCIILEKWNADELISVKELLLQVEKYEKTNCMTSRTFRAFLQTCICDEVPEEIEDTESIHEELYREAIHSLKEVCKENDGTHIVYNTQIIITHSHSNVDLAW